MELITDQELITEYLNTKSEKAARIIVEKHKNVLFSAALNFTKNFDDAEDLTQETFIKGFNNLHTFQYKSSLRTWLYKILKNLYLNSITKKNIDNTMHRSDVEDYTEILSTYSNPENELEYKEFLAKFHAAINSLPAKQQEVFIHRHFDELKYEEIAEMLDVSVGTLKANYYHATKKLAEILKNYNKL